MVVWEGFGARPCRVLAWNLLERYGRASDLNNDGKIDESERMALEHLVHCRLQVATRQASVAEALYQLATFRRAPIKTPSARSQRTSKGMVKRAPSEETAEGQHETADEAAMEQLLDSPMMNEFLGDPEKIEQSRQLILQNPMMVNMFKSVPGLEDVVNDKEKWAQQMKEVFTAQRDAYRAKKDASKASTP